MSVISLFSAEDMVCPSIGLDVPTTSIAIPDNLENMDTIGIWWYCKFCNDWHTLECWLSAGNEIYLNEPRTIEPKKTYH